MDYTTTAAKEYGDIVKKIRELSAPIIEDIEGEKEYQKLLQDNFEEIGKLSESSKEILNTTFYPLINKDDLLTDEEIELLKEYSNIFFDARQMTGRDLSLKYILVNRLLEDADKKDDISFLIESLDLAVEICFAKMHATQRLLPECKLCYRYRDEGFKAAYRLLEFLPKEEFAKLPNESSKHLVLVNSRYISALFDRSDDSSDEINKNDLALMKKALSLCEDEFYLNECPNYNWNNHKFRTLQYIADFLDACNQRHLSKELIEEIYNYTVELKELYESDTDIYGAYATSDQIDRYVARAAYLTERAPLEDYKKLLIKQLENMDLSKYGIHDNITFVVGLNDYLIVLDKDNLSEEDKENLKKFYQNLIIYIHRTPKYGSLSFLLTFLTDILHSYIEFDGADTFDEFCLKIMTALQPTTYIHSLGVAQISEYLTKELLEKEPERFMDFLGCDDVTTVYRNFSNILEYMNKSALIHDVGKLMIMETIITYGRNLTDNEFEVIKTHPVAGAYVLEEHSTKPYANVAKYHHTYYNCEKGYPIENNTLQKDKVIIDIATVADCLDAATDVVGRCFKKGKTLQEFIEEIRAASGTTYAPYVVDLFDDEGVVNAINEIITKGRNTNYKRAYSLLANQ